MTAKCTYDLIMGEPDPNWSKNDRAKKIMGKRPTGYTPIDFPCELDYHCPVCKYEMEVDGNPDTRLHWSEYNGFLWCEVCNRDYPSALCMPDISKAIDIYLSTVEEAVKRAESNTKRHHHEEIVAILLAAGGKVRVDNNHKVDAYNKLVVVDHDPDGDTLRVEEARS